jgi:hypothetical protein
MSRRHVRLYYFDAYGHEIPKAICSAVMPMFKMPLTRLPAKRYAGPSHQDRRELAAVLVLNERRRRQPKFSGVLVMACPARDRAAYRSQRGRTPGMRPYLVPTNSYLVSFAAISTMGQVVAGDVMAETLGRAYREGVALIREVLARRPGELPAGAAG